jgi:hypothetical protein
MVKHLHESGYHAVCRPFGVELVDWRDWRSQLPAPEPTPRLPGPSEGHKQPRASDSPSAGTRPVERLSVFFKLLRRFVARRPFPGDPAESNCQPGRNKPGQTASREAGSHT